MKSKLTRQRGMTFWTLCAVLAAIAVVTLFGLRAFPLYQQKFSVIQSLKTVVNQPGVEKMSKAQVYDLVSRNFSVNNVNVIPFKEIKKRVKIIRSKKGGPKKLQFAYAQSNKLFADLQLTLQFDQSFEMRPAQ